MVVLFIPPEIALVSLGFFLIFWGFLGGDGWQVLHDGVAERRGVRGAGHELPPPQGRVSFLLAMIV